jgi:hypothetical protein
MDELLATKCRGTVMDMEEIDTLQEAQETTAIINYSSGYVVQKKKT